MGYSARRICLFAAIAGGVLTLAACEEPPPLVSTAFVNEIPDVVQTAARGSAYGNGQQFCAPAAAANALSWLAGKPHQVEAVMKKLSTKAFMNTSLKNGTGASGFLVGVDRYARSTFGRYNRLELRGWRSLENSLEAFRTGEKITAEWLAKGVGKKTAVWLNIGWYRHSHSTNEYLRFGGHWVTLVGYDFSRGSHFIIHDPAPRAGRNFTNHKIFVTKIDSGWLRGRKKGLPRPAISMLEVGGNLIMKRGATVALVDAAIRLDL